MRGHLIAVMLGCLALSGCVFYLNPQCNDQIHNGDETDIDCGGSCGKCEIGSSCKLDTECEDSNCRGGRCTAFPCFNEVRDGDETDVDCGGTCRTCSGGRHCVVDTDCASGTCLPGTNTCKGFTALGFQTATYPAGLKPYAIMAVKLDGRLDDRTYQDLVVADELGDLLFVFKNAYATGGSFPTDDNSIKKYNLNPDVETHKAGIYPTGGAIADFNHDGKPDVITADYHGNAISVLLNAPGTPGTLAPTALYENHLFPAETSNLALGDLDGDGNLDAIATNPQAHSVSLYRGRADGTFQDPTDLPVGITGSSEPYSAAIADFNKDGFQDFAVADDRSRTMIVRLGNGDGTFQPEVAYPINGSASFIVITADLNGDGNADLVCSNRSSDDISVLLGRGDGTFRKAIVTSTGLMSGPYSVSVDDFNLDGVPDVVTGNYSSTTTYAGSNASVLLGIGNGKFEPAFIVPGLPSYGTATGDFNGDGLRDFATANFTLRTITVQINTSR